MKLDFTPVYAAFGIGLATYLVLRLKKVSPDVKFKDIRYDKRKNEVELVVENVSDNRVFVKPALRLVRLTPASEWREKTSNSGLPFMTAAAGSVIKGYELLGEYAEAVEVEPKASTVIRYPVMGGQEIRAYDNIKVDSPVGRHPRNLDGSVTGTVQVSFRDHFSDDWGQEILDLLKECNVPEETAQGAGEGPVDGGVYDDSLKSGGADTVLAAEQRKVPDGGVLGGAPETVSESAVRRSDFPIQAICYCCGKERWLSWVVDDNHVCEECRDFLGASKALDRDRPSEASHHMESQEQEYELEVVETPKVDLKPRHRDILSALSQENTMSAKEVAKKVERGEKTVAADLRYLLKNNLVDRVKIGNKFKYFALGDEQQFIIRSEEETENPEWT